MSLELEKGQGNLTRQLPVYPSSVLSVLHLLKAQQCGEANFHLPQRRALGSLGPRQRSNNHEPSQASSWRLFSWKKPAGKAVEKPKAGVCTPSFGRFPRAASNHGLPSLLRLLWHMRQPVLLSECQRERLMGYCLCVFLRWK